MTTSSTKKNHKVHRSARNTVRKYRCHRATVKLEIFIPVIIIAIVMAFNLGMKIGKATSRKLVVDRWITYQVQPDDTLSSIASKYKMECEDDYRREAVAIREVNDINMDCDIYVGDILNIPIYKYELVENIK